MRGSNLNTNYKIPPKTLSTLCDAIERLGFDEAFDIALNRSLEIILSNPESMIITEYLSWSHNLAKQVSGPEFPDKHIEAAAFYRKLAHHIYWTARKHDLVAYNENFIQAVK